MSTITAPMEVEVPPPTLDFFLFVSFLCIHTGVAALVSCDFDATGNFQGSTCTCSKQSVCTLHFIVHEWFVEFSQHCQY